MATPDSDYPFDAVDGEGAQDVKATGSIWGDFTLERRIGSGGMGAVYLARQAGLDRKVALKVLSPDLSRSPEYRKRFTAEAKAAARISSPNVVSVYACGEHANRLWYAMEYVEGQDLAVRLGSGWHPDWRDALRLASQAARGLAAAHRLGLVHRDIKPANLMLANDGTLKVADFGLVRTQKDKVDTTATGAVLGTVTYIAPEQARGESCDHRADLYALGCVLYELLCRRPPFTGESMANLITQHLSATPFPPSRHAPWLPTSVDRLVLRLLAKDPAARPPDASHLAAELERLAQNAMPAGRQDRGALIAIAAVVALGLAGGAWWWFGHAGTQDTPPPAPAPQPVAVPIQPAKPAPEPPPAPPAKPEPPPEEMPVISLVPHAPTEAAGPDIAQLEKDAAALVTSGEHLGPAASLRQRLGAPLRIDHQGSREFWQYGRYTFVIEDGLVLNARKH